MGTISEARLYVLVTSSLARHAALDTARMAIEGGADVIQLREKEMPDEEYLRLAEEMRTVCRRAGALFVVNDRAAIARLVGADGIHVGQDDLPAHEARAILRPGKVLGVSTHDPAQARKAQSEGADYIGVGPIYPTSTRGYEKGVGVSFIREAAHEVAIPFFAIGGITLDRLDEVIAAGATRVAVSSAIIGAKDVAGTARKFKDKLRGAAK